MKKIIVLISVLAWQLSPAWAVEDLVSSQMVDQARTWSQKGRDDLASQVWRSLLLVEPNHPEALVKLGLIEARAGNAKEAKVLYLRASRLKSQPKGFQELATQLALTTEALPVVPAVPKVVETKLMAPYEVSPKPEEEKIKPTERKPVKTKPHKTVLTGTVDLGVYTSQMARNEKWEETRRGLEQLAQDNPNDARYLLALANHLTYRESTRREAIRQLEALTSRGLGTAKTKKVWKKALQSLTPRQGDQAMFSNYLSRYPGSKSILKRLNALEGNAYDQNQSKKTPSSIKANADSTSMTSKPVCSNSSCK